MNEFRAKTKIASTNVTCCNYFQPKFQIFWNMTPKPPFPITHPNYTQIFQYDFGVIHNMDMQTGNSLHINCFSTLGGTV